LRIKSWVKNLAVDLVSDGILSVDDAALEFSVRPGTIRPWCNVAGIHIPSIDSKGRRLIEPLSNEWEDED